MDDALSGTPEPMAAPEAPAIDTPAPAPEPDTPEVTLPPKSEAKPLSIPEAIAKAKATVAKQEATSDRARDEQGRFAATEKPADADPLATVAKPAVEPAKPVAAPASDAPSRFSPDAKAAWATTPEPVKAEVSRAMTEMQQGLNQYQQRFEPLKPYFAMAEREGTTIDAALQNYVRLAQGLKEQPEAALNEMFRHAGIDPKAWAAHVMGQPQDQQQAQSHQVIQSLQQELAALKEQIGTVSTSLQSREQQELTSQIEQFKAQSPRFDELTPYMHYLLTQGIAQDLPSAYAEAERVIPAASVAAPTPVAPQPRKAPVQISGAPSTGSNPAFRQPSNSIGDSIRRAKARVGI